MQTLKSTASCELCGNAASVELSKSVTYKNLGQLSAYVDGNVAH